MAKFKVGEMAIYAISSGEDARHVGSVVEIVATGPIPSGGRFRWRGGPGFNGGNTPADYAIVAPDGTGRLCDEYQLRPLFDPDANELSIVAEGQKREPARERV